jgi:hypothetical protein
MKKLMMAMVAGACLAAFGGGGGTDSWVDGNGLTWTFNWTSDSSGSSAKITKMTGYALDVTVPGTVKTSDGSSYTVTGIGSSALASHAEMRYVTIPATITTIDSYAFAYCSALSEVHFKGKVPPTCNFNTVFYNTTYLNFCTAYNDNDNFSQAEYIYGKSSTTYGNNYLATKDVPASLSGLYAGVRGTKWYRWTAPITGHAWAGTTAATTFDTVIGVYQGYSLYSLTMLGCNNDFLKGGQSMVAFPITAGEEYRICVAGVDNSRGEFNLQLRTAAATVTLTFDTVGGLLPTELASTFPVPKNAAVGDLPAPTKDYYTFSGWYTKKSGGSKVTAKTKFKKNTKVYARWAKQKYKVTLTDGIFSGAKKFKGAGKYPWGKKVEISVTAKPGCAFWGWVPTTTAAQNAFPKYATNYRKSLKAKITVPKEDVTYQAWFYPKEYDTISMSVTGSTEFYAEDGVAEATVDVTTVTYPTVKASGLPKGVTFKIASGDSTYKLRVAKPDQIPPGRHVVKVTAKNRSGKTATKNFVIWGRNNTEAVDAGVLNMSGAGISTPSDEMRAGMVIDWSTMGISAAEGKITKIEGLPAGLKWSEKKQTLTGYPTKAGYYTLTFTVKKGGKKYKATKNFYVRPVEAVVVGTFKGYTKLKSGGSWKYGAGSRQITVSVTKDGKVTAKIGDVSFSGSGFDNSPYYRITLDASYKQKKVTCHRTLTLEFPTVAAYNENGVTGTFEEYFTKKGDPITYDGTTEHAFGRKNAFGRKDNGEPLVNEYAQSALELVGYYHASETFTGSSHSITVKLNKDKNNRYNGMATLSGKVSGKAVSGTAMLTYEGTSNTDPERAIYGRFTSGASSIEVKYKIVGTASNKPTVNVYVK